MTRKTIFSILLLCLVTVPPAWAGGVVAAQKRARQRMIMEQRIRQEMIIRQQQAQQQQAQQAVAQQPMENESNEPAAVSEQQEQEDQTVRDVVTPQQLIAALKTSGQSWSLIIDRPVKVMVVNYFIRQFAKKGITISKPAAHYVSLIDGMSRQSPGMLKRPFPEILEVVAIIEYDFNNGQNKDAMALKVLGSRQAVEADKQRLGL